MLVFWAARIFEIKYRVTYITRCSITKTEQITVDVRHAQTFLISYVNSKFVFRIKLVGKVARIAYQITRFV